MRQMILIIAMAMVFIACSSKPIKLTNIDDTSTQAPTLVLEEQYEKGYAQGIKDNKDFLIDLGFAKAMKVLNQLLVNERAICAGRYAIEESFVTNPKVISTSSSDKGVEMKVIGCKINTKKTPQELLNFYAKNVNMIPVMTNKEYLTLKNQSNQLYNVNSLTDGITPSASDSSTVKESNKNVTVGVNSKKSSSNLVTSADFNEYEYTTRVAKNDFNAQKIQHYSIPALEKETHYVLGFSNQEYMDTFCSMTKICER
jgi:hypothetical protein